MPVIDKVAMSLMEANKIVAPGYLIVREGCGYSIHHRDTSSHMIGMGGHFKYEYVTQTRTLDEAIDICKGISTVNSEGRER